MIQKKQKQLVILLEIKVLTELRRFENLHQRTIQKQMKKKYLEEDIYLFYFNIFYYYFVSFRLTTVVMITQILYKMISKLFIRLQNMKQMIYIPLVIMQLLTEAALS